MEWILDFIERNENARQQLNDGDVTAFKRSRDGRLWPIKKHKWGDVRFWNRVRRTGHVRDTVVSTAPVFIKKGIAGGATKTGRPTLNAEIEAAYKEIRDAGDINFDAPKTTLYEPIRKKVREREGAPTLHKGLGKEAIRKAISGLFEADKKARAASP